MFDFTAKTAIVTEAASGIGEAIALELAASGAVVVVSDLDADAYAGSVASVLDRGRKATAFAADFGNPAAMALPPCTLSVASALAKKSLH